MRKRICRRHLRQVICRQQIRLFHHAVELVRLVDAKFAHQLPQHARQEFSRHEFHTHALQVGNICLDASQSLLHIVDDVARFEGDLQGVFGGLLGVFRGLLGAFRGLL